jgi:chemotaxis signal transduction protein
VSGRDERPGELAALRQAFDEAFAAVPREASQGLERLLILRVGGEPLLARLDGIDAVERLPPVVPLPGAPAELRGLAGLRSRLVPVYDLSVLLGGIRSGQPAWLVLSGAEDPLGLAADGFEGQLEVARTEVLAVPSGQERPNVPAYVRLGGELRGVIDLRTLAAGIRKRAAAVGPGGD